MRTWQLRAPWWVLSLVAGTMFGGFRALWAYFGEDASPLVTVLNGVIGGVFFGALMGLLAARGNKRLLAALDPLPVERQAEARRAAFRGRVPDDPEVREAATRLVTVQADRLHQQRWWAPLFWIATLALGAWLAVTSSPWWWLAEALFAALLIHQLWLPRHLQRRLDRLRAADGADQPLATADRDGSARDGSARDGSARNGSARNGSARHRRPGGEAPATARRGTSDHAARHKRGVSDRAPSAPDR